MADPGEEKVGQQGDFLVGMAAMVAVFTLPALSPGRIGWLINFVPLPVFYFLSCWGPKKGLRLIGNAILVACAMALIFRALPELTFVLTFVPLGFVLFQAARQKKTPVQAGINGVIALAVSWLIFWAAAGLIYQTDPYGALLSSIDEGLAAMETLYLETYELPNEARENLTATVKELRNVVPGITPALLASAVIFTVCSNLVLGNWLLRRKEESLAPWPAFKEWRLPDSLVWGGIIGGGLVMLFSGPLDTLGGNVLIVWGALYFIQGLGVLVSLLNRWLVPTPFRILIYGLIILQSYGILLLAILGLIDVWADLRRILPQDEEKAGK